MPNGHHFDDDEPKASLLDWPLTKRVARLMRPALAWMGLATLLLVVVSVLNLARPKLIEQGLDRCLTEGNYNVGLLGVIVALYAGASVGIALFGGLGNYMLTWAGQRTLFGLRVGLFEHLQRMSIRFFDERASGKLISRATSDVDAIDEMVSRGPAQAFMELITLIGAVVLLFRTDVPLALALLALLPIFFILMPIFRAKSFKAFRKTRKTIAGVNANLQETIAGIRTVQTFAREELNDREFAELNAANRDANIGAARVFCFFFPIVDLLHILGVLIILGYGGIRILEPDTGMTIGKIMAFLGYLQLFFMPIRNLTRLYHVLQRGYSGAERIFEIMDTPPEVAEADDALELPPIQERVSFDKVTFHYNPEEPVLKDVSFGVPHGQTVALVGPTGAGKTTVVNLLARMYDPIEGSILFDGTDIRSAQVKSLRRQIATVLQDSFLFAGTIAENIRYGREDATDEEVRAAADAACAAQFIARMPGGYEAPVHEQGSNLSSGQRQLLSFARAILADPRVLILDEATASVDTRTEKQIQEGLKTLLSGRTSFVIAHRLSTIVNADQVLVVQGGEIVDRGTHHELLTTSNLYRTLYTMQFRELENGGQ